MAGSVPAVPLTTPLTTQELEKERRLTLQDGKAWAGAFGYGNHAKKNVNLQTAMQLATVWACVRLTAQAVSCLPLSIYEKRDNDDRAKVAYDDDIAEILCDSPNADQTPLEFWEGNVAWLLTDGNAYSEKVETPRGRLSSLEPLSSAQTVPHRKEDGTLVYRYTDRGKVEEIPRDKIFHLKGFNFGGDAGMSAVRFGAQTFGAAMAVEETTSKLFGSGLQASGVLSSESTLDPKQRGELQGIMEKYVGSSNAGKLMILEAGLKYEALAILPVDAQLLESHRFSIEEMCRWFGVPPIIIGHAAQGQTMWGSGVEQIFLAWMALGIDPLCDRIEARIKKLLLRPAGFRRRYAEFNREALLQSDSKAKAAFLSTMTQNGLMTRNEGRAKLNLSRMDGGDELTAQTNLAPLSSLGAAGDAGTQARAAMRAWLDVQDRAPALEEDVRP